MKPSKGLIIKLLISAVAIPLLVVNCSRPSKKEVKDGGTNFEVKSGDAKIAPGDALHTLKVYPKDQKDHPGDDETKWKIPQAVTVTYQACFNDLMQGKPIKGQKFEIQNDVGEIFTDTSDSQGCIRWSEPLSFNFFAAKATYVELDKTVRPVGGSYHGQRILRYAVNPWQPYRLNHYEAAVFLNKHQNVVPSTELVKDNKAVLQALNGTKAQKAQLVINDLHVAFSKIGDRRDGQLLQLDMEMSAGVLLKDIEGFDRRLPLSNGHFRLYTQVVATHYAENVKPLLLSAKIPPTDTWIRQDDFKIHATFQLGLDKRVSKGQLYLVLHVIPMDGPDLKPYDALVLLGEDNKIRTSSSPMLISSSVTKGPDGKIFSYDQYISPQNLANFDELLKEHKAEKNQAFYFSTMKINYLTVKPGETATERTIEYRAQTCVTDNQTGRVVRNEAFWLKKDDNSLVLKTTDDQGCIPWIGELTHKYYQQEQLFFKKVQFYPKDTCPDPIKGVGTSECRPIELEMALDPWDSGWQFAQDRRVLTDNYIKTVQSRKKLPSLFFLQSFSYTTLGFHYEVDQSLGLKIEKRVLLNLEPYVLRYNSIKWGRQAREKLKDGFYLLKIAMVKSYLDPTSAAGTVLQSIPVKVDDPNTPEVEEEPAWRTVVKSGQRMRARQFISIVKKLVRVQNGEILTPVTFSLRDVRLLRIRCHLLIELQTVDEKLLEASQLFEDKIKKEFQQSDASLKDERAFLSDPNISEDKKRAYLDGVQNRVTSVVEKIKAFYKDHPGIQVQNDMNRLFLEYGITQKDLDVFEKNNFTLQSPIAAIDYDKLVDLDSGLKRRTFIGPLTLYFNTNSSKLRTLDNLDEMYCQQDEDCNQASVLEKDDKRVDNSGYERSPLYGAVTNFFNKSVDDLIPEKIMLKARYNAQTFLDSQISAYMKRFNYDYVSLRDQSLKEFDPNCQIGDLKVPKNVPLRDAYDTVNKELQEKIAACRRTTNEGQIRVEHLLTELNKYTFKDLRQAYYIQHPFGPPFTLKGRNLNQPVTVADLDTMIDQRKMDDNLAYRFCGFLSQDFFISHARRLTPISGSQSHYENAVQYMSRYLYMRCMSYLQMYGADKLFYLDKKLRVKRAGQYRYRGGKMMNIGVDSSFQMQHSDSIALHGNVGVDLLSLPFISVIPGTSLFRASLNLNRDRRKSETESTAIRNGTFLVMQTAALDIGLLKYEQCVVLRFQPEFLHQIAMVKVLQGWLSDEDVHNLATKALFICKGIDETKPRVIRERYYYFTQHFVQGDILDQGDIYNHPWLLALRGIRDFRTFLTFMKDPGQFNMNIFSGWGRFVKNEVWPIDQLTKAYLKILPSFPGIYTVIDEASENVLQEEYPFPALDEKAGLDENLDTLGVGAAPFLIPQRNPDDPANRPTVKNTKQQWCESHPEAVKAGAPACQDE